LSDFELIDEEIFDPEEMTHVTAVVWWLTHLLGGKVIIPRDKDFWMDNFPPDARLVMREENGQLALVAEQP
jgi:hypothetical protein